jgi:hypothetical protein
MSDKKTVFETLAGVNLNDLIKIKGTGKDQIKYLSWADAWAELKRRYPDATYKVLKDQATGLPYFGNSNHGYIVMTEVTVNGDTLGMWLPVLDHSYNSMKDDPYEIKTKYKTFTVNPISTFDVNKAIMRCLVKNIGMHGLGHYLYTDDEVPPVYGGMPEPAPAPVKKETVKKEAKEKSTAKKEEPKSKQVKTAPAKEELPELDVNGEKWDNCVAYVKENKALGFQTILQNIRISYKPTLNAVAAIKEIVEQKEEVSADSHEHWNKIEEFVKSNRSAGFDTIVDTLREFYEIDTKTENMIKNLL